MATFSAVHKEQRYRLTSRPPCKNQRCHRTLAVVALLSMAVGLLACARDNRARNVRANPTPAPTVAPSRGGRHVIGEPYMVNGMVYVPRVEQDYDRTGIASVASPAHTGRRTANGERVDAEALTGAHPTLPLPSYVEVTNLENACMVVLRINDRGPFGGGRIVQVSPRAARLLGMSGRGLVDVRVRHLGPAPLNGDTSYEEYFLTRFPDRGCLLHTLSNRPSRAPALGLEPEE